MRIRFSRAGYALAAGVAVTALLGMSAASASTSGTHRVVSHATSACSYRCLDLFNQGLGPKHIPTTGGRYGDPVHLTLAHNFLVSQDFIVNKLPGDVKYYCTTGIIPVNSYICTSYPFDGVYEAQYSPASFTSGLCAGVGRDAVREGGLITLRDCGDNARTLWVADAVNRVKDKRSLGGYDYPLVNAASGSLSIPLVLTTNDHGTLTLNDLRMNGVHGTPYDSQEWGFRIGPAH
jgi:hypothetical protein